MTEQLQNNEWERICWKRSCPPLTGGNLKEGEYLSKDNQSPRGDHTDVLQWSKAKSDELFSNVFITTIQRAYNKICKG